MPPPTVVASEAATRACWQRLSGDRASASFTVLPTGDIFAPPAPGHRLPSTRPIDHRWDRSRGIIFNNHQRRLTRDHTWTPTNGIVFTHSSTPTRNYGSRKIGGSYSAGDDLQRDVRVLSNSASTTQEPYNTSAETFLASHDIVRKLNKEIDTLREDVGDWKSKHARRVIEQQMQQEKLNDLDQRMRQTTSSLATTEKERIRLDQEGTEAKKEIERLMQRLAELTSSTDRAVADGERLRNELQRVTIESTPDRHRNEVVLAEVREKAKEASESVLMPQISRLTGELESEQTVRRDLEQQVQELQSTYENDTIRLQTELQLQRQDLQSVYDADTTRLQTELDLQRRSLDSQRRDYMSLQAQLDGRRDRRVNGRSDYATYRLMHADYFDAIHDALNKMDSFIKICRLEQDLGEKALSGYRQTELCRRLGSGYPALHESLEDFWAGHSSTRAKLNSITDLRTGLMDKTQAASADLHASRSLTRFLHLDEVRPMFMARGLSNDVILEMPLHFLHAELDVRIETVRRQYRTAQTAARPALEATLSSLLRRRSSIASAARWTRLAAQIDSLRSLLADELMEKQLFVKTHHIRSRIEQISFIRRNLATQSSSSRAEYHGILRQTYAALDEYSSIIRRESHLAKELGEATKTDRHVDAYIQSLLDRKEQQFLTNLTPTKRKSYAYATPEETDSDRVNASEEGPSHSHRRARRNAIRSRPSPSRSSLNIQPTKATRACQPSSQALHVDDWINADVPVGLHLGQTMEPLDMQPSNSRSEFTIPPSTVMSESSRLRTASDAAQKSSGAANSSSSNVGETGCSVDDVGGDSQEKTESHLTYQIPPEDLRHAVMASPSTTSAYWHFKLYKNHNGSVPTVYYCTSLEKANEAMKHFAEEKVLGFDLEWEPGTKRQDATIKSCVSLIQIACESKIGLFHIARFSGETVEELLPPALRRILESRDVIKAGVNVAGDARRMQTWLKVGMCGVFELSHLFRIVRYSENQPENVSFRLVSLSDQVHDVLSLPLKKDNVRISRWSTKALNGAQSDYAASDAYAGFRLFHSLEDERKAMRPTPPRPAFFEEGCPLVLGDGTEIFRGQRRGAALKKRSTAEDIEVDAEAESDEFFDAVENLENAGVAFSDDPACSDLDPSVVEYPPLPMPSVAGDEEAATQVARTTTSKGRSVAGSASSVERQTSPEIEAANSWVSHWRTSRPREYSVSATDRILQVYHLWHHQNMHLQQVADHCRTPPLAISTVSRYVLSAIVDENLPYDSDRVREPLRVIPSSVHGRYQKIIDRIDG